MRRAIMQRGFFGAVQHRPVQLAAAVTQQARHFKSYEDFVDEGYRKQIEESDGMDKIIALYRARTWRKDREELHKWVEGLNKKRGLSLPGEELEDSHSAQSQQALKQEQQQREKAEQLSQQEQLQKQAQVQAQKQEKERQQQEQAQAQIKELQQRVQSLEQQLAQKQNGSNSSQFFQEPQPKAQRSNSDYEHDADDFMWDLGDRAFAAADRASLRR